MSLIETPNRNTLIETPSANRNTLIETPSAKEPTITGCWIWTLAFNKHSRRTAPHASNCRPDLVGPNGGISSKPILSIAPSRGMGSELVAIWLFYRLEVPRSRRFRTAPRRFAFSLGFSRSRLAYLFVVLRARWSR